MRFRIGMTALTLAALAACGPATEGADAGAAADTEVAEAAPAAPSQADLDYEALTASWDDALHESCGPALQEALGTRDLVDGILASVEDPDGRATAEVEDATHWMTEGNAALEGVWGALEDGDCGAEVQTALEETWQFYVKAGTSAVQATQMVAG
ncbi:MAG: hypothetical protein ABFS34_16565 [Gemmatimonadota bacterium]